MQVYGLNLQYDFDTFSIMSSTSYGELDIPRNDDLSSFPIAPGFGVADLFGGLIYQQPISVVIDQLDYLKKRSQELRVSSKPGQKLGSLALDWQAGVFYTKEKTILDQRVNAFNASGQVLNTPPLGAGVIPAELEETSGFADLTLHFTERFDIAVGARRSKTDQWNQTENYCCVIFGPADKIYDKLESDEKKTTYSIAPRYKFDDGTVLYARYATGYRAGGPNLPVPGVLENPPPLLPDSTKNYEIGVRTDLLDNRVSIDVTVFQIDWKDAQVLSIVDTPAGPFGINGNAGTATSKGLEWNLGFRPTDNLLITLVGAYTDATVTKDAPGLGALDGDDLPFVSDLQATLNVDWTIGTFAGFDTVLGATYTYTGERYTNFGTAATTENHVKLPDYETVKLQLGIDNGKFNAQLYVNNLTDEDALLGYYSAGAANLTGFGPVMQPRTIGVFAGYKF
ncbi:MAG: TonB-dependent receptor domain-containing protein [Gammaproteobacteria bacterium]